MLKLDIRMFVDRPKGSSAIGGGIGLITGLYGLGRADAPTLPDRMTTSSRSSPECTPLEVSEDARSGGDAELLSLEVVSDRGVRASGGIPESALRRHRGVMLVVI